MRRFLRHWAAGTALALGVAAFAYFPYVFPALWEGDLLALAYTVRYAYLMATLWIFGPAASFPAFALKIGALSALLGLLLALPSAVFSSLRARRTPLQSRS